MSWQKRKPKKPCLGGLGVGDVRNSALSNQTPNSEQRRERGEAGRETNGLLCILTLYSKTIQLSNLFSEGHDSANYLMGREEMGWGKVMGGGRTAVGGGEAGASSA